MHRRKEKVEDSTCVIKSNHTSRVWTNTHKVKKKKNQKDFSQKILSETLKSKRNDFEKKLLGKTL